MITSQCWSMLINVCVFNVCLIYCIWYCVSWVCSNCMTSAVMIAKFLFLNIYYVTKQISISTTMAMIEV